MSSRGKTKRSNLVRKKNNRKTKKHFLIVTNGTETEYNYFKSFKANIETVKLDVTSFRLDPLSLIIKTQKLKKTLELKITTKYNEKFKFDEVWCVFDKDEFPDANIQETQNIALKSKVKLAYSNEAFELWFLLHFNYYENSMGRKELKKKLNEIYIREYNTEYSKADSDNFIKTIPFVKKAIKNSKKLNEKYSTEGIIDLNKMNPSTAVHELVIKLLE